MVGDVFPARGEWGEEGWGGLSCVDQWWCLGFSLLAVDGGVRGAGCAGGVIRGWVVLINDDAWVCVSCPWRVGEEGVGWGGGGLSLINGGGWVSVSWSWVGVRRGGVRSGGLSCSMVMVGLVSPFNINNSKSIKLRFQLTPWIGRPCMGHLAV